MVKKNRVILIAVILLGIFMFSVPAMAAEEQEHSLDIFREVFQTVLDNYIHELDAETLEEMAIRGLMQQLDDYSRYFNREEFEDFRSEMGGRFGGVGLHLEKIGDYVTVVAPLAGTPGERAGIIAGDIIIMVDDVDVIGMNINRVVSMVRGEPGTSVELTIIRESIAEPLIFNIERSMIEIRVIESEMLEGQIGYIHLAQFTNNSHILYAEALDELLSAGARGIILDLRNNPGGQLWSAISVANSFVADGESIVHIESRLDGGGTHFAAYRALGIPLVVLVNGGSASGSEIVAGAVQDHGAGTLVGTRTFGKATVQQIHELSSGGAVLITAAQYLTPDERQIDGVGIEPDVVVEDVNEQLQTAIDILKEKLN